MKKEKDYIVTANYSKEEVSFKMIIEKHIKNLIKIPVNHWQLKENSIKYKRLK